MSMNPFKLPQNNRKNPHQELEYWQACKIDHFENGILIYKQCRKLSGRDLIQLARDAAKYVFFHYPWSRKLTLEKLADVARRRLIKFENQNTSIEIKLLPLDGADLINEKGRNIQFCQAFQKHFALLQGFKSS